MVAVLYILLGAAIGVGITLIILQERFVRQRRLLVAMGESERAKSSQMLHELDDQWKQESRQFRQKLKDYQNKLSVKQVEPEEALSRVALLKEKLREKEESRAELEQAKENLQQGLLGHKKEISDLQNEISFLKNEAERLAHEAKKAEEARQAEALAAREAKAAEEKALRLAREAELLAAARKAEEKATHDLKTTQKPAPSSLEKFTKTPLDDDDFLVFRPGRGRHLLPGSIARAFMKGE